MNIKSGSAPVGAPPLERKRNYLIPEIHLFLQADGRGLELRILAGLLLLNVVVEAAQGGTIHRQDANSIPAVPMQQTAAGRKLLCFRRWKRGIKQPATGLWSLPENLFPAICRLRKL